MKKLEGTFRPQDGSDIRSAEVASGHHVIYV